MERDQSDLTEYRSYDGVLLDLTRPLFPVEVKISDGPVGKTLWVNIGPCCVLRICQIEEVRAAQGSLGVPEEGLKYRHELRSMFTPTKKD